MTNMDYLKEGHPSSTSQNTDGPPPYQNNPPSGYRVPSSSTSPFPSEEQCGKPASRDLDGSPIYIGSALFASSVHPCKVGPRLTPACMVPYGGTEYAHNGRYDLLPFRPDMMEWVRTSHGRIPPGRRPIQGGYEENGAELYHGMAVVDGVRVPGKCGEHLGGCNVPFGGAEHNVYENYEILCWK